MSGHWRLAIIAVVQIASDGTIVASLDTDDMPSSDDERDLAGLSSEAMLDVCAKVAIETHLKLYAQPADA